MPVLPIAVGSLPEGLARVLHAIGVGPELRGLSSQRLAAAVQNLVEDAGEEPEAAFRPALRPAKRAELLGRYAREAIRHKAHGPFRQRGDLPGIGHFRFPISDFLIRQLAIGNRQCGDWFLAESVTPRPGKGYYQTIFTCHAPTILERIRQFDVDFDMFLQMSGAAIWHSRFPISDRVNRQLAIANRQCARRQVAIAALEREIAGIRE